MKKELMTLKEFMIEMMIAIKELKKGKIGVARAKMLAKLAGKIVNGYKAQFEYMRLRKKN